MFHRRQQQFIELPPTKDHGDMLLRLRAKPRDNEASLIFLSRSAVGGEEIVRLGRHGQPYYPGQTFSIRSGPSILIQMLG